MDKEPPPDRSKWSDAKLVAAFLTGKDDAAFAAIRSRHQRMVERAIGQFVWNRSVAEEVAQETWERIFKYLKQWEEARSSLRAWIVRVAVHCATRLGQQEYRLQHAPAAAAPANVPPPAYAFHAAQGLARLLEEAGLTPAERVVVSLRLVGKSHREIAAVTESSTAAVRLMYFRARRKLQRAGWSLPEVSDEL